MMSKVTFLFNDGVDFLSKQLALIIVYCVINSLVL